MIKASILFILLLYLFSPILFAQQNFAGFPSPLNERSVSKLFPPMYNNPRNSNNFIRIDSITSRSITVFSYGKYLFQYNSKNLMTQMLGLFYSGSIWESWLKSNYYYDAQDELILAIDLFRNGSDWDSTYRTEYAYENGMLAERKIRLYSDSNWVNIIKTLFTYNTSGDLVQTLDQEWSGYAWEDFLLITRYYSQLGKLDSILFQIPEGSGWQDDKKTIWYYAANEIDVDSMVARVWSDESWVNLVKRNIINDENHNQVELTDQDWINNNWLNSSRLSYSYNSDHYIESIGGEIWENNNWIRSDVDMTLHNPDGFTIGFLGTNEVHAFYSYTVGVMEDYATTPGSCMIYQNYPNPFNPATTIHYQLPQSGFVSLKVYDILGREVANLVNQNQKSGYYTVNFNASNLPSGVYIYTLNTTGFTSSKKMLLIK